MKFVSTRICQAPKLKSNQVFLSYDYEIWHSTEQYYKVKYYFNDQFGNAITKENLDEFQPKNKDSLEFSCKDFLPCILSVEDEDFNDWIEANLYYPETIIYDSADLYLLGYDVMDLCCTSIKSHGISPEYEGNYTMLNKYGLLYSRKIGEEYLIKNLKFIPEHSWKLVGVYTNKRTLDIIEGILLKK